jgi:hypothetical protein
MTREERLYSMRMVDLVNLASNLGIKINRKAAKSEAIEKILLAEQTNKENEKAVEKEKAENDAYVAEVMQQKADLGIECPPIDSYEVVEENLVPMPGAEKLAELKEEVQSDMIDKVVFVKFVKKAQRLITQATHDSHGYHVTINVNGKDIFYHDKNLQNIRSAIGHIYRGEVEV